MVQDTAADLQELGELEKKYDLMHPEKILAHALNLPLFDNTVIVSSFGAESAVLLHMIAQVRTDVPVLFIDTGKLFGETLRYRDQLQHKLGLEDLRIVSPRLKEIQEHDADGTLNRKDPDFCCEIRKVRVLDRVLSDYSSWITGRKRYQSTNRNLMPIIEYKDGKVKLNPMANFFADEIRDYMLAHALPDHPMYKLGYKSIGCFPCTSKTVGGDDRSGRWSDSGKTECGIHR